MYLQFDIKNLKTVLNSYAMILPFRKKLGIIILITLKTYATNFYVHHSRVRKQVKLSGFGFSTIYGFESTQLHKLLCHIHVPTF